MTAPDRSAEPADDLRDHIAASVRHHIDHEIIAEWICCDPVNPSHHLCCWGEGVRQTMRSLLADNDDEYQSKAIDGITADLQPVLDAKDAEIVELDDRLRRTRIELDHWRTVITAELRAERDQLREQLAEKAAEVDDKSDVGHAVAQAWQQRAETAERELAALRAHQQTGDQP